LRRRAGATNADATQGLPEEVIAEIPTIITDAHVRLRTFSTFRREPQTTDASNRRTTGDAGLVPTWPSSAARD
jgi:hypothetical protein